jgi:hypothetical protein
VHWLTQLHGDKLIDAVCREKLSVARRLTAEDVRNAVILSGRIDEDVCSPPSLLSRAWKTAAELWSK